jgi:hypothetical protein
MLWKLELAWRLVFGRRRSGEDLEAVSEFVHEANPV